MAPRELRAYGLPAEGELSSRWPKSKKAEPTALKPTLKAIWALRLETGMAAPQTKGPHDTDSKAPRFTGRADVVSLGSGVSWTSSPIITAIQPKSLDLHPRAMDR